MSRLLINGVLEIQKKAEKAGSNFIFSYSSKKPLDKVYELSRIRFLSSDGQRE